MVAERPLSESRSDFYVYVHRRASDGSVFYVGRGRGYRARNRHGRSDAWLGIVAAHGFTHEIVHSGLTEEESKSIEVREIARYGRDTLCNMTDGGEGLTGYKFNKEVVARAAEKRRGQKRSPETLERLAAAARGRRQPESARRKLSALWKGKPLPIEAVRARAEKFTPARRAEYSRRMSQQMSKPVVCIDTGEVFPSAVAASRAFGSSSGGGNISACCTGRRQLAFGHHWRHA